MKLTSITIRTPFTPSATAHNVGSHVIAAFLADAAGDSYGYAEKNNSGVGAEARVYIRVNAELELSLLNFAHYSEESYQAQANLWEVGVHVNGDLLGTEEGEEELYLCQLKTHWLVKFFEALDGVETVTPQRVYDLLKALSENR